MKLEWVLFEIFVNIFQGIMFGFFLSRKLTFRNTLSKPTRIIALSLQTICVAVFFSLYIWFDIGISDTCYLLITFLFSMYLYSEKWYVKLAWNTCLGIILICIASLYSSLFMHITKVSWDILMAPSMIRLSFMLNSNAAIFIALFIVTKLKPKQNSLSIVSLILYIILNCILIFSIEMQFSLATNADSVDSSPVFATIFALFAASIIALIIFEILSFNAEQQAKLKASLEVSRLSEAHNEEIRTMYENILVYRHDIKHHISAIENMLESGDINNSRIYIDKIKSISLPVRYSTGNTYVDSVLSVKTLNMKHSGIIFDFISYPLHTLPIPETDFCSMLGNILDNAIEAACRLPVSSEKKIKLQFSKIRNMLYITCSNTADITKIQKVGNSFLSSKRHGQTGIGIPSIIHIVESAEGVYSFNYNNGEMEVEIALPYLGGI